MLVLFTRKNTPTGKVNKGMNSPPSAQWTLVSADLLRTLMNRCGDGSKLTVRSLADRVGVPIATIGKLLTGTQASVRAEVAQGISDAIGVGVLILFTPPRGATLAVARIAELTA